MLQSMGSQRVRHDLATEQQQHSNPNQSILKEIDPGYSLEGLLLKLKLQYFGYWMRRGNSLEKTLMLGKIEGQRKKVAEDEMVR